MTDELKEVLISIATERIPNDDPSHDIEHTLRVLANALRIADEEQADIDVIIPAALFHDIITYPKNDPRSLNAQEESAQMAHSILTNLPEYPVEKIPAVMEAILLCSFTKGVVPELLEAKILQDADGLEATGAIAVMRTYASTGQMQRPFYHPTDPFGVNRQTDSKAYALDLFFDRLLKVEGRMHTQSAKHIAQRRTVFLYEFLEEFRLELEGK